MLRQKLEELKNKIKKIKSAAFEHKHIETILLASDNNFKKILERSPIAFQIYSPDGFIREVNKGWENLWHLSAEEAIDKFNALEDEQAKAAGSRQNFETVFKGEVTIPHEFDYDPKLAGLTGRKRRIRPTFYPLIVNNSTIPYVGAITEDVTDLKLAEDELNKYKERQEEIVVERTKELTTANRKLQKEITHLLNIDKEHQKAIAKLVISLDKIKMFKGVLPICANCKNIRDDNGFWQQIESYFRSQINVEFSHSICPNCMKTLYSAFYDDE